MLMGKSIHPLLIAENNTLYTPIVSDIFNGVEELCLDLNEFFLVFFSYMKYIFALVLLLIGTLTLLRFRGIYLMKRIRDKSAFNENKSIKEKLKQTHVFLGIMYLFMGCGILFNYLTHILIWVLEPLPDGFLFQFLGIGNVIDPNSIYRISNYDAAISPHEKTIYFCFALVSLIALLQIILSIWFLTNETSLIHSHTKTFLVLFAGIIEGMLFGFTTSLRFFL
ncbi:MAG: conserved membrane protein of unknown function [Promethearchaeota archaeon]|nr:MAG: conserved membrane protein of unknown function [Candidatus Lokiarchaeota archaeon]